MLTIGLTGGIGSGKSTVAQRFSVRGIPIIDADEISHELVKPHQPALQEITRIFGPDVLDAQGGLDRARIRDIVFVDPQKRKALEAVLHPLIRQEMQHRINILSTPLCILVIPLLVETGSTDMVERVLVVDANEDLQIKRIKERDKMPEYEILAIMKSQAGREQRLAAADDVIINEAGLDKLYQQVDRLVQEYETLALASKQGAEK